MPAQKPIKFYLTQLEHIIEDEDSDRTTIFRTLSKDDITHIENLGEAPYKRFVKREQKEILKNDLDKYPPLVDVELLIEENVVSENSLLDDKWFSQLITMCNLKTN
ncbi:hypothetical protein [Brevibacillus reuszeri]|uniref:hypothetical protein n=1 Tax=Brevibacillus reuszeri TaxID=54915 RepID=UPI000CCC7EED|nr:hypothetical protein [Brevibacillus reuszeri]